MDSGCDMGAPQHGGLTRIGSGSASAWVPCMVIAPLLAGHQPTVSSCMTGCPADRKGGSVRWIGSVWWSCELAQSRGVCAPRSSPSAGTRTWPCTRHIHQPATPAVVVRAFKLLTPSLLVCHPCGRPPEVPTSSFTPYHIFTSMYIGTCIT